MKILHIASRFPVLTQTFVESDIQGITKSKDKHVFTLLDEKKSIQNPENFKIRRADIKKLYLKENLYFLIYFPSLYLRLFLEYFVTSLKFKDIRKTLKTIAMWKNYIAVAYCIKEDEYDHIHSHWAHFPGYGAYVISTLLNGIPFSVSGHAYDLYKYQPLLAKIICECKFFLTTTKANIDFLNSITDHAYSRKIKLYSHGVDCSFYTEIPREPQKKNKLEILTIGRMTEKKGFSYLLESLGKLKKEKIDFRLNFVAGEGPEKNLLKEICTHLNIKDEIHWIGSQNKDQIRTLLLSNPIFVLPCIVAKNGDRDGIPNVVLEAMASGCCCITTNTNGLKEVIKHEITGLIVPEKDSIAIFASLKNLFHNQKLIDKIGKNASAFVFQNFDRKVWHKKLSEEFYVD